MARQQVDLSRWAIAPMGTPRADLTPKPAPVAPRLVVAAPRRPGVSASIVERPAPGPAPFVWLGAHGGAGVTSLAATSGIGLDLSLEWPSPPLGWPASVALVCRTSATGLDAAAHFLHAWASRMVPGINVVALVTVASEPGRLPKSLRTRIHELSGAVPSTFSVAWIPSWREQPRTPDKGVHRTAAAIAALTNKEYDR